MIVLDVDTALDKVRLQITHATSARAKWFTHSTLLAAPLHSLTTAPPPSSHNDEHMSLCSLILMYAGYTHNIFGSERDDREIIMWDSDTAAIAQFAVVCKINVHECDIIFTLHVCKQNNLIHT